MGRDTGLVLAIEPDVARADVLRRLVRERLGLDIVLVSSSYAATVAMNRHVPGLLLFSAALSDRNQNKIIAHYRSLTDGLDPQTLTIPLFREGTDEGKPESRFTFKWRRPATGSGSDGFFDSIEACLKRVDRSRLASSPTPSIATDDSSSSDSRLSAAPPQLEPGSETRTGTSAQELSHPPISSATDTRSRQHAAPVEREVADVDLTDLIDTPPRPPTSTGPDVDLHVHAADVALVRLEAEQTLAAELDRLRLEAMELRESELARVHAEAEAVRVAAVAGAREAAEAEARDAWMAELARVKAEAEHTLSGALMRARAEAEETLTTEVLRARDEAERQRVAQLAEVEAAFERAKEDAERARLAHLATTEAAEAHADSVARRARAAEAEAEHERLAQLERLRVEAEALRQSAVIRAREEVEAEARETLGAELARVRSEAEFTLNETLARVRHEAETTLGAEVSRAREQAERSRADELARMHAAVEERVSQATRLARETAEADAAKTFSEELARARMLAEASFAQELARVKSEAEYAVVQADGVLHETATRARAEAEATRHATILEARAAAEAAAQQALERETTRLREEAESRVQTEIERLRQEAEYVRQEAARVQSERSEAALQAEQVRNAAREVEREIARVRTESEERLAQELERVRLEAERLREAERDVARHEAERLREAAARDARAVAETALHSELSRVRAESEARIAAEVGQLRAEADKQRTLELTALRTELANLRDAARAATLVAESATQATSGVGRFLPPQPRHAPRVDAPRSTPSFKPPVGTDMALAAMHRVPVAPPTGGTGRPQASPSGTKSPDAEFWAAAPPAPPSAPRSHRPWRLAAATSALLIASSTAAYRFIPAGAFGPRRPLVTSSPGESTAKPAPQARRTGEVTFESTPPGAIVIVDGQARGRTPVTVADLQIGGHTVTFEINGVNFDRAIRVRADAPTTVTQDLTAGFLSIFSRIQVTIQVDGRPAGPTAADQLLLAPGVHSIVVESTRFKFRSEFTVDIKPGEVTAHTVMLPLGALVVRAEPGAEVWVEGELVGPAPVGTIAVAIGTRNVLVKSRNAELRRSVEVVFGEQIELDLRPASEQVPGSTLPPSSPTSPDEPPMPIPQIPQ